MRYILLYLFVSYSFLFSAPVVRLNERLDKIPLDMQMDILEDKEANLSITDVRKIENEYLWLANSKKSPNFGVTDSVYWLRIRFTNEQTGTGLYYLKIANPFLDFLDGYFFINDRQIKRISTGEQRNFANREVENHHFVFQIKLEPAQTEVVYFQIQTTGVMDLPIQLYSYQAFQQNIKYEYTGFAIYFGLILSLLLYNLFLYISIREMAYLYYVLFLISMLILSMSMNGLANEFFWPNNPLWGDRATNIFLTLALISAGLFIRSYINLPLYLPRFNQLSFYLIGIISILGIVSIFKKYPTMIFLYFSLIPSAFFAISVGLIAIRRQLPASQYYLIAWFILLSSATVRVLKALGFLTSSFFTEYSVLIGSALEMLIFSFGLADKINQEKKAKQAALNQVHDLLVNLEEKVKDRTRELEKARQQADSANQLKDKFLSIVSHDLRSPISGVLNLIEVLRQKPNQLTITEVDKYLKLSYNSLSYSLDMTEKLLDLNKIGSGRIKLQYSLITINDIFQHLKNEFLPVLQQKNIILTCKNHCKEVITVDVELFSQILRNLLSNAIKFTPNHGQIQMIAKMENNQVIIKIEDTGSGIPEDILPLLFDKTKKTSRLGTQGEKGHGLGLLFSYDSIRLHHGTIRAGNRQEGGAYFQVEIPHNDKTMILADDSTKYRNELANIFREEGWLVIEAIDGRELLKIMESIIPEIVITDKNMPGMNGVEAIEQISQNEDYKDVMVFLLSGDFSPEFMQSLQKNEKPALQRVQVYLPRFESMDWIRQEVLYQYHG